jgi:hypothetical protein
MAQSRDEQEAVLVLVQKPGHAETTQELVFVLGPPMTISGAVTIVAHPQISVIS